MNLVPVITILLWLVMAFGYRLFPGFFLNAYIQFPLVVLLSILLPVSFWLMAQAGKKYYALLFLGIFCFNIGILLYALERNYASQRILEDNVDKGIIPEIAELLAKDVNIEKRQFAAQYIFQHHAIPLAYKTADNSFVLYTPNETDRVKYRANFARKAEMGTARMNSIEQLMTTFFLLILHAGIFLFLILFLIMYEPKEPSVA